VDSTGAIRGVSQQGSRLTSRATPLGRPNGAGGDTNGDTLWVAKQVHRCKNLGEIQVITMVSTLLSRTKSLQKPAEIIEFSY
jgi:hypothetical protein